MYQPSAGANCPGAPAPGREGSNFQRSDVSAIDEFVAANEQYAAGFFQGDLAAPPALRAVVVTCMDARIDPMRALGLELGDAHIIRNSGGRMVEALRSLAISQ